jgi:hypothetical protein
VGLVVVAPETRFDDPLQIDPSPSDDAVHLPIGTGFDAPGQILPLRLGKPRGRTGIPVVKKPIRPRWLKRCTQSRSV